MEERMSVADASDSDNSAPKRKPMRDVQRLSSLPHILYSSQGREKPGASPCRSPSSRHSVLRMHSPISRRSSSTQNISPVHSHPLANPFRPSDDDGRRATLSPLSSCPNSGMNTPKGARSRSRSPAVSRAHHAHRPSPPMSNGGDTRTDATTNSKDTLTDATANGIGAFSFNSTEIPPRSVLATQKSAPEPLQTPRVGVAATMRVDRRQCKTTDAAKRSRRRSLHVPHTVHVIRTPPVQRGRFSMYFEEDAVVGESGTDASSDEAEEWNASNGIDFESGATSSGTFPVRYRGKTSPPLGYDKRSQCTPPARAAENSAAVDLSDEFAREMGFSSMSVGSSDSPLGAGTVPANQWDTETPVPAPLPEHAATSAATHSASKAAINCVAKMIGRFEPKRASKKTVDDARHRGHHKPSKFRRRRKSSEEERNGHRAARNSNGFEDDGQYRYKSREPFPPGYGRIGRRGTFSLYE